MRNPRSAHSFLCYLHACDRLSDFLSLRDFFPTRLEFNDYMAWCAESVSPAVHYNTDVIRVERSSVRHGSADLLAVVVRGCDGGEQTFLARAVSLAMGIAPRLPDGLPDSPQIWHTSGFLDRARDVALDPGTRVAIIGGGQSAAEAAEYFLCHFPQTDVHVVMGSYGFPPADDSPFINSVLDPEEVDAFHAMPQELRDRVRTLHAGTNYGVVSPSLIQSLYRRYYAGRVSGQQRLYLEKLCRLGQVHDLGGRLSIDLESITSGGTRSLEVDLLVCATGYKPVSPESLLSRDLRSCLERDSNGSPILERDYRMRTRDGTPGVLLYAQCDCEVTHGLSATLLSNLAVRSGEIRNSLARQLGPAGVYCTV
jgi:L-ornithine N5-oxygenase